MFDSLVKLLQQSVSDSPDKEVVIQKNRRITYEELWEWVNNLAAFLNNQGLSDEARVAILVENSPEYIAAYYGVLAAGGTVVGLNSGAKARDLVNWIKHSGAKWLITNGAHPELDEVTNTLADTVQYIFIGETKKTETFQRWIDWKEATQHSFKFLPHTEFANPDHMAAIIYTSGTTGKPKGVTLSHKNLLANTQSIISYLELKNADKVLNVLPFHYSYGNSIMHTHLAVGGSIVLENSLVYPQKVLERMANEKVTGFSGVPSTYALLQSRTNLNDYDLSSVRYMTQAGGAMAPISVERFTKELPHVRFFVMYGQTEATARIAYLPPSKLLEKSGSVGLPIPGVSVRICDENDLLLSPGVTGQIQVKGDNIMLGYWRDNEATRRVIKDGWLHTGDLAHQDVDGYIFIDGRSSDMIKVGANRVSPKEIEEVILELKGVEEVAAVGVADDILGQVIKAVLVLSPGSELTIRDVQAYCHKNLASYKIPKLVKFVSELPKTSSGKVRRFLLQEF